MGPWFLGRPRYTKDLDIVIRSTPENAARMEQVLRRIGFTSSGLKAADFLTADQIIQIGNAPQRIDILTTLTGVDPDELWSSREAGNLDGIAVFFVGRSVFIKNKRASGRPRDLADLDDLSES